MDNGARENIDEVLARQPHWNPPADFAVRLAAAAARQAAEPVMEPASTGRWLLERLVELLPVTVGALLLALLLALLPWAELAGSALLPWLVAGGSAAFGLLLTVRVLRSP